MIKDKPCNGTGIAKGFGCGKPTQHRIYGLGKMCCYANWLFSDNENAKLKREKFLSSNRKSFEKEIKKKDKSLKVKNVSVDEYRAKYVQPKINHIAREIDFGQPCISSGNYGKMNGGHFIDVGSNRTTAINLHNIHIQTFHSNHFKSGDKSKYRLGIIEIYGNDYFEFMESLHGCPILKLNKDELIEIKNIASDILKELKENQKIRTAKERIELRNEVNLRLNIYEKRFAVFD